jgi:hypothetical protein
MVRFSDMLGRSGEPDDVAAANSPYAELANYEDDPASDDLEAEADVRSDTDAAKEPVPMSAFETPEAVLNRLTQYASSARAAVHAPPVEPAQSREIETQPEQDPGPELEPEPEADPLSPVGDDFLPNVRRIVRRAGRGWKRHQH